MNQLVPGTRHHGFLVLREGEVPRLNTRYRQLRHEATGATLYYTDRDDGQLIFSVGFRTLPEDDTGVFHILEHSCLDGSEHYRLKEPFVNLLKTSMAVDLNAMTYEDKTVYYFISTNEQDFCNLMEVYLDAVFHPLLLSDRRIFDKEAWHFEPDGEGGVSISGVVFNEMQGNDNQPDYAMWMQNERQVFPDLFFRYNSGGDPAAIPNLTYEQFVETYRRFYSAENAVFYLSGNLDTDARLADLDRVLSAVEPSVCPAPGPAPLQTPVVSPDGVVQYQLADNEEEAGNTHLMLTYILGDDRSEEVLAFSLLSRYLAENTESPLSHAVLNAGVGQDFDMICEGDYRQPMLCFTLGKTDPEHAEGFRQVILNTLETLVQEGFDTAHLADLVDGHETDCRRAALSVKTGFRIMESFLRTHVQYGDADPVDDLAALRVRMAEDNRYFEHLVERYILRSEHWAMTRCVPSRTLTAERRARMQARCAAEAERINGSSGGYASLEADAAALAAYLTAPDTPEAEAAIPHLTPADLDTTAEVRDMAVENAPMGGTLAPSLFYEADLGGMVVSGLLLDLGGIPDDDLFYVRCLRDALLNLATAEHTIPALTERWIRLHTAAQTDLHVESNGDAYLALVLDAPEERLADAVILLDEYLRGPVFDPAVLRHIFAGATAIRDRVLVARGNRTALRLATRTLTVAGMYDELFSGESAYRRLVGLSEHFEDHADALVAGMTRVWRYLTETARPTAYLIGSATAYDTWKQSIAAVSVGHDVPATPPTGRPTPMPRRNYALTVPGEVNYCAEVYDLRELGRDFDPRHQVVNTHLYSRYFWDEIRAKGGAYGASASSFRQALVGFSSYRDPRVGDTYAVYRGLPDWLDANIPDASDIDALIVSTVGSTYFAPRSPIDRGNGALGRYLLGKTASDRRAEIETILSTTAADFAAYASDIRALQTAGRGIRTALGGAEAIRRSGLFAEDDITEL